MWFDVDSRERVPRYAGLILQLVGAGLVWIELSGRRKFFGLPPSRWSRPLPNPFARARRITATMNASEGVGTMRGSATVTMKVTRSLTGLPIDEQLEILRNEIDTGDQALRNQIEAEQRQRATQVAAETETRQRDVADIHRKIQDVSTGDINIPEVGVLYVIVGQIVSAASQEIALVLNMCLP